MLISSQTGFVLSMTKWDEPLKRPRFDIANTGTAIRLYEKLVATGTSILNRSKWAVCRGRMRRRSLHARERRRGPCTGTCAPPRCTPSCWCCSPRRWGARSRRRCPAGPPSAGCTARSSFSDPGFPPLLAEQTPAEESTVYVQYQDRKHAHRTYVNILHICRDFNIRKTPRFTIRIGTLLRTRMRFWNSQSSVP